MIGCRFAVQHPSATESLTCIASSLGGWAALPETWRGWRYAFRMLWTASEPVKQLTMLKFHFTRRTLVQCAPCHQALVDILSSSRC